MIYWTNCVDIPAKSEFQSMKNRPEMVRYLLIVISTQNIILNTLYRMNL